MARRIWQVTLPLLAAALGAPWLAGSSAPRAYAALPAVSDSGWSGQGRGHSQGHGAAKNEGREHRGHAARPEFRSKDREIIIGYYRNAGLPPGLAKRGGNLPPGLEKQLARNGTLPPGLAKRLEPLPPELERRLPPLPSIYERGVIGNDVVVVNRRTGAILDIIRGVTELWRR